MQDHPYRHAEPPVVVLSSRAADPEAGIIYGMLMIFGIVRLAMTVALGEAFETEATVAIGLVLAGLLGFARGR